MKKSKTQFQFKQFTVYHDQSAMKVGTDSVVLGAWARINPCRRILDVGTGCGVLALMFAQRSTSAIIDAVEVDELGALQARQNAERSPWPNRIEIHHTAIQQYVATEPYDVAVSNPPYFVDSLEPPDARRLLSRHAVSLTYIELIDAFDRLLLPDGRFSVILPATEGSNFTFRAAEKKFYCTRKFGFRTRPEKPVTRWLLEFSRDRAMPEEGELVLYDSGLQWSENYMRLTRAFYLNL
jgi:tRNA1Val (adenine37-N6)-methyltransferase